MNKLELYYPVRPFIITQKFGETAFLQYYKDNGVIFNGHNGTDCAATHGEPVRASHDGTAYTEVDKNQGHGVFIVTDKAYEYKGQQVYFKSIYWHLIDNIPVVSGQVVKAGEIIGYANNTGLSTGNHLHFAIKPLAYKSPLEFSNLEPNNGYQGAIDASPYFNGKYADELTDQGVYIFGQNLELGNSGTDVLHLQIRLKKLNYFPLLQDCTGYYGSITRAAVFAFQNDYIPLNQAEKRIYKGRYFGQKTRAALNALPC